VSIRLLAKTPSVTPTELPSSTIVLELANLFEKRISADSHRPKKILAASLLDTFDKSNTPPNKFFFIFKHFKKYPSKEFARTQ
jgi:hypothetical protein